MNVLHYERYGKRRNKPLEAGDVPVRIGLGGLDGRAALRLCYVNAEGHEVVLLVNDPATLSLLIKEAERAQANKSVREQLEGE